MEDYRCILGENIRRYRKKKQMTQEDLAELTGMQPSSVGKVERGQANPSIKTIQRFSEALEVDLPELFVDQTSDDLHTYLRNMRLSDLPEPNRSAAKVLLQALSQITDEELDDESVDRLMACMLYRGQYSTYRVITTTVQDESGRKIPVYGIRAAFHKKDGVVLRRVIRDLSTDRRAVERFAAMLNHNFVSQENFIDLLDDFMGDAGDL